MEDGYLSPQQAAWVRAGVRRLLGEVLPDAVGLVDAFGFSDYYLDSSLGLYDGDWYECRRGCSHRMCVGLTPTCVRTSWAGRVDPAATVTCFRVW